MVFHVLNRGVARMQLFEKAADYQAFEQVLRDTLDQSPMRICAYAVMPNHWHLLLWPECGTGKRDGYDIDKMGSFGLWFGDATNSAGRSWWNGFSRFKSRRGANAVVRESGRLPSIRAGFAGYS
jgi:hypothetical protein